MRERETEIGRETDRRNKGSMKPTIGKDRRKERIKKPRIRRDNDGSKEGRKGVEGRKEGRV